MQGRRILYVAALAVWVASLGGCLKILGDFTISEQSLYAGADGGGDRGSGRSSEASAGSMDAPRDSIDASPGVEASLDDSVAPQGARLSAGQATLDFGTLTIGNAAAPGSISVTNVGVAATQALATALVGSAFGVDSDGCAGAVLAPQQSCAVGIKVSTASSGRQSGSVTITDPATNAVTVSLVADVRTPGALGLAPPMPGFGGVPLNAASAAQAFTVTNASTTTSGPLSVSLSGSNASEFVLTDPCSNAPLAANATCTLSVVMKPTTAGSKTASLAVSATPGGTATASLSGRGLAPASLSVAPSSYAFPVTVVGATGAVHTWVIRNGGDVASPAIATGLGYATGTQSTEFAITSDACAGQTLAGAATCNVSVSFNPATFGNKAATLLVNGGPPSAAMTGTGQDFVTLTVGKNGSGGGTVSGDQIDCGATCSEQVVRTTSNPVVTLTATPDATSTFGGWAGAGCSGTATCSVSMSQAQTVSATFTRKQVALTMNFHALGQPSGAIASAPIGVVCSGQNCTQTVSFDIGTTVALTVSGLSAGSMSAWSNGCTGTSCSVTLGAPQTLLFTSTTNNIVFVTSSLHDGSFGGLPQGDAICNGLASAAGVPGHFVAFLGTSTTSAFSRLSGRGWIRPDGLAFGDTIASLQNNSVWYPTSLTERGTQFVIGQVGLVWTGQSPTLTCSDWTTNAASAMGSAGVYMGEGQWWQTGDSLQCNTPEPLMCFGTDFNNQVTLGALNGLASGRHVFVSNATLTGAIGGAAAADLQCQSEAGAASLANAANFKALLATTSGSAASRFNLSGATWVRPDGVMAAASPTDFMNAKLLAPIPLHADGTADLVDSWIGSSIGPTAVGTAVETCNDWSTASSTSNGWIGNPFTAGYHPWNALAEPCSSTFTLICLEN
jgi:hypothetical protein